MHTAAVHQTGQSAVREQRRYDRIERRFSTRRTPKELVRDLLRAHSGG